jgi:light-regulated signal transduction histidine kinase (bacteriophytochrome)
MPSKKNTELDDFLYLFSHDFSAPLRHIREFTKLMLSSLEGKLGEKELKYAYYINEGVKESEAMLADILRLSRINNPEELQEVSLKKIISETAQKFQSPTSIFTINSDDNIILVTEKYNFKILLNEIFNNAIKFNKSEIIKVNIDVEQNNAEIKIAISDNGIGGVNKSQQVEMFKIFRKLNGKNFQGTGVGLTICKKIMDKLNGEIKFEESNESGTKIVVIFKTDL